MNNKSKKTVQCPFCNRMIPMTDNGLLSNHTNNKLVHCPVSNKTIHYARNYCINYARNYSNSRFVSVQVEDARRYTKERKQKEEEEESRNELNRIKVLTK